MARPTRGSIYPEPGGTVGVRWPEDGKRPQRGGFKNKTEARAWFDENVRRTVASRRPIGRGHVRGVLR